MCVEERGVHNIRASFGPLIFAALRRTNEKGKKK